MWAERGLFVVLSSSSDKTIAILGIAVSDLQARWECILIVIHHPLQIIGAGTYDPVRQGGSSMNEAKHRDIVPLLAMSPLAARLELPFVTARTLNQIIQSTIFHYDFTGSR